MEWKTKSKGVMILVTFVLMSMILLIPMAVLAQDGGITYTEVWDKQGTGSLECDLAGEGPRTEDGWIHWVFSTKGDSTSAELVLGGSGSGTFNPAGPLQANTWHFYTPYFDTEGLTATINLYGGAKGPGGGLVISDYCPGNGVIPIGDPVGSISITKVIQNVDGTDLSPQPNVNIVVNVKSDDGEYDVNHTVNPSTGPKVIENLPVGDYTITEVDHDDYENVSITPYEFELIAGETVQVVVTNRENEVVPIGDLTGSISITKVIQDSDGVVLSPQPNVNIVVNVKRDGGGYDQNHTVNPSIGPKVIANLPLGNYTITEVDYDEYENVSIVPYEFTLTADVVVQINIINREIEGVGPIGDLTDSIKLIIEKVLLDINGNPVSSNNVMFTVILDGGSFDEEEITFSVNSPAEVVYADGLEFGIEYTITEVDHANYDFVSINQGGVFTLTEEEYETTVTVTNRQIAEGQVEVVRDEVRVVVEYETPQIIVVQEQPQTTPDPDETETIIVWLEEPQTDPPTQEIEVDSEDPAVDPDDLSVITIYPAQPQSTPKTSGTVIPNISLAVLLLISGGVLQRKYRNE